MKFFAFFLSFFLLVACIMSQAAAESRQGKDKVVRGFVGVGNHHGGHHGHHGRKG
jgi:hypothetical protein